MNSYLPWDHELNWSFALLNSIKKLSFLDSEWLIFSDELKRYEYDSTPLNALTFAITWWDGVHFSFIEVNGECSEKSPIVMTVPMGLLGQENMIIWENLYDFLALWIKFWYFWLEQLHYNLQSSIKKIEVWEYFDSEFSWESENLKRFSHEFDIAEWEKGLVKTKLWELKIKYYWLLELK